MPIATKTFAQFSSDMVTAWASALGISVNLASGSLILAESQAVAGLCVYLQGQNLAVQAASRASTAVLTDLDSWQADFGYSRVPATYAWAPFLMTAGPTVPSGGAIIPYGTIIQVAGGTVQFTVIPQPTGVLTTAPAPTAGTAATISTPNGTATVYAEANVAGSAANLGATLVNQLGSPIAGIVSVSNTQAITNGANAATDPQARLGFIGYINSLSKATAGALTFAEQSANPGIIFTLQDAATAPGIIPSGQIYVVYPDPTQTGVITSGGATFTTLGGAMQAAVAPVEAFGITASAFACFKQTYTITVLYVLASGFSGTAVDIAVIAAVSAIQAVVGGTLTYSALVLAVGSVSGVQEVCSAIPAGSLATSVTQYNALGAGPDLVPSAAGAANIPLSLLQLQTTNGVVGGGVGGSLRAF